MSDTGYWLVMAFMAVVVVVATGGVTTYAYFSQDRWAEPRELVAEAKNKVSDTASASGSSDHDATAQVRVDQDRDGERTAA